MKRLTVEVCVCTECIMNGAMEIIEAIEGLKKIKTQIRLNAHVTVETLACIGEPHHGKQSPIVRINDQVLENVTCETVMSRIISVTTK